MTLKIGDQAPVFSLPTETGECVTLDDFRGKTVVLFFYPKDDTPGCTKESCEFRDLNTQFSRKGAVVLGVSADDEKSHQLFKNKYGLNFPLLSDTTHEVSHSYGVWGMQEWGGRTSEGITRTTFVIDPEGEIAQVYERVDPVGHAERVLLYLDS